MTAMSDLASKKADYLTFPTVEADATGKKGVTRVVSISAAGSFAVPTGWRGSYVVATVRGGAAQLGTSNAAVAPTLVYDQAAAAGAGSAVAGAHCPDAGEVQGIIDVDAKWMCYMPDTGATVVIEFRRNKGDV